MIVMLDRESENGSVTRNGGSSNVKLKLNTDTVQNSSPEVRKIATNHTQMNPKQDILREKPMTSTNINNYFVDSAMISTLTSSQEHGNEAAFASFVSKEKSDLTRKLIGHRLVLKPSLARETFV